MRRASRTGVKNLVGTDPQFQVNTRDEIFWCIDFFDRRISLAVGGAHHLAARRAASRGQNRDRTGPVVATGCGLAGQRGNLRSATEFTHDQHQGGVEQSTLIEVFNQSRDHGVQVLAFGFEGFENIGMVIPAAAVECDERDSGFPPVAARVTPCCPNVVQPYASRICPGSRCISNANKRARAGDVISDDGLLIVFVGTPATGSPAARS